MVVFEAFYLHVVASEAFKMTWTGRGLLSDE